MFLTLLTFALDVAHFTTFQQIFLCFRHHCLSLTMLSSLSPAGFSFIHTCFSLLPIDLVGYLSFCQTSYKNFPIWPCQRLGNCSPIPSSCFCMLFNHVMSCEPAMLQPSSLSSTFTFHSLPSLSLSLLLYHHHLCHHSHHCYHL